MPSVLSGSKASMSPRTLQAKIDADFNPEVESYEDYATRLRAYLIVGQLTGVAVDQAQLAYKLIHAEVKTANWFTRTPEEVKAELQERLVALVSEEPEFGTVDYSPRAAGESRPRHAPGGGLARARRIQEQCAGVSDRRLAGWRRWCHR